MLPLLEQVVLVLGRQRDRGVTPRPRLLAETGEPIEEVNGTQPGEEIGILEYLGCEQRVRVRPCRLLEFVRAALTDSILIGRREAARVEEHRGNTRRAEAGEGGLRVCHIRQPHCPDRPVAPRLLDQPGAGVVAIGCVIEVLEEEAFRSEPAAAVLADDDKPTADEGLGDLGAGQRLAVAERPLRATHDRAAIRCAFDDGERTVDGPAVLCWKMSVARRAPSRIVTMTVLSGTMSYVASSSGITETFAELRAA